MKMMTRMTRIGVLLILLVLGLGGRASAQTTAAPDSLVPKLVTDSANMRSLRDTRQRFAWAFGVETVRRMTTRFTPNAEVAMDNTFMTTERFAEWLAILRVSRSRWTLHSSSVTGLDTIEDVGEYEYTTGFNIYNGTYRITWQLDLAGQWRILRLKMIPV